jgi:hypothetical protein
LKKFLFLYLLVLPFFAHSQKDTVKLNDVKLNITSLTVKNYHIIYERNLAKKISVALGLRYMPKGDLPFQKQFKKQIKSDKVNLDQFRLGDFAVTPEGRYYLGKGCMRGFYISLYGRYTSFAATVPVQFTKNNGTTEQALFDGKISSFSGGIMFGIQYTLWKIMVLDVMLLGGHYGGCSGTFNADNINPPLTAQDQQSLQESLNTINAKPFKISGQVVSSTKAVIKASGPW